MGECETSVKNSLDNDLLTSDLLTTGNSKTLLYEYYMSFVIVTSALLSSSKLFPLSVAQAA